MSDNLDSCSWLCKMILVRCYKTHKYASPYLRNRMVALPFGFNDLFHGFRPVGTTQHRRHVEFCVDPKIRRTITEHRPQIKEYFALGML